MTRRELAVLGCFAAIFAYQTMLPPVVGLANDGDFGKILGIFDLAAPVEDEYQFAPTRYSFHPAHHYWSGFYSSEMLLAGTAIALNTLVSKDGTFDLRFIGMVHEALLLIGVALLLPLVREWSSRRLLVVYIAVLLIFGDVMYAAELNSFYMDSAAFVFLVLALVFLARAARWRRIIDGVGLLVCAVLMTAAKTQHATLGLLIAVLFLTAGSTLVSSHSRRFSASAATLLVITAVLSFRLAPFNYIPAALYSVIFLEVLPNSTNVDRDLRELGLDGSYKPRIGTHAYSPGVRLDDPEVVRQFLERTSYWRVGWFFVNHPSQAWRAVRTSLDFAGRQRASMGNFDRARGLPPFAESHAFSFWSTAKRKIFEGRGALYFFYFLLLAILNCVLLIVRRRYLAPAFVAAGLLVAAMASLELLVSSLGDAVEVTRHFFLFNALLDVLLVMALVLLTDRRISCCSDGQGVTPC